MTTVLVGAVALLVGLVIASLVTGRRMQRYVAEAERGRDEYRRAIDRLGDVLAIGDDRGALMAVVLQVSADLASADGAVFWVGGGNTLVARATHGVDAEIGGRAITRGDGLTGWAAEQGEATMWPPGARKPAREEPPATAAMAVPLRARGGPYGVLSLYRSRGAFTTGDLEAVSALARQAEAAIDTTFVHDEAKRLSLTDGLTGLWNRRQLELRMTQEQERATRFGEQFSLVLIDLDDFKPINDTYGHPVGDAVLVELARRLVEHTREVDVVARYGGEEFALLLPQTDLEGAVKVAEKIRSELAGAPIETEAGPLQITLSAGVATHPADGSAGVLLSAADTALYAAKGGGKNRVLSSRPLDPGATTS